MSLDLDDAKTSNNKDSTPGVPELCEVYKFPERKWVTVRLRKGLFSTSVYWIKTKKKDGSPGKFPHPCPSYDPQSQERDSTIPDPWRDYSIVEQSKISDADRKDKSKDMRDILDIQFNQSWWMQGIVRSKQRVLPDKLPRPTAKEKSSGFKEKDSDSLTPVYVLKMGKSLLGKIQELKGLNTVEGKNGVKAFAVNDDKYGRDIKVFYDSKKAPADQYQVQLGDSRTPITEVEETYLSWDLGSATAQPEFDHKAIAAEFAKWAAKMGIKLNPKKSAKKDVEEDEDFDEADDEDEEDEKPKKKVAKGKAKKDEDEDDFDEDEDEDEDDEDPPAKKKTSSKATAKKKTVEEDDDFDDEESEDDEDEPPKKKKVIAKSKAKDEDDFDEDDAEEDDLDEDEEDELPKKKTSSKKPPAKSSKAKKPVDEDEDEDEEEESDDDFDEDEDDEPAPKPKTLTKGKTAAKKKKPVDDEDDDF